MFALIDGNSFYCSCERAFDPTLRGKPVAVLSNNDGCAIARTTEAKDLGLKMGEPWHLASKRSELKPVIWMSSNYALYGDMSRRMYEVLVASAPAVDPYSIDEMFLDLAGLPNDHAVFAATMRERVRKIAKIPTCVGIGPTKTIAKLANKVAKGERNGAGVCDFADEAVRKRAYPTIGLGDVWGLGPASVNKLKRRGIESVADFVALPNDEVRELLTVVGARTHAELMGTLCFPFAVAPSTRKSLAVTRSFGRPVTNWIEMEQAIASYATRAAEKLRRHKLVASAMQVFVRTNEFNSDPRYSNQATFEVEPSADTLQLIADALRAGKRLWRDGFRYAKAGVVLLDLKPRDDLPQTLFPSRDPEVSARLMAALDAVNIRYGRRTLAPAIAGVQQGWSMRRQRLSPRYTTHLDEVLEVRADRPRL
jgi:DNA polymerase V